MKPTFTDLSPEERETFGDGCTWVPDLAFGKLCRKHDWFYSIGCGADKWYENLWKAPYHKLSEDFRLGYFGIKDSIRLKHPLLTPFYSFICVLYSIGTMLLGWPFFTYGRWRTLDEIREKERQDKMV